MSDNNDDSNSETGTRIIDDPTSSTISEVNNGSSASLSPENVAPSAPPPLPEDNVTSRPQNITNIVLPPTRSVGVQVDSIAFEDVRLFVMLEDFRHQSAAERRGRKFVILSDQNRVPPPFDTHRNRCTFSCSTCSIM